MNTQSINEIPKVLTLEEHIIPFLKKLIKDGDNEKIDLGHNNKWLTARVAKQLFSKELEENDDYYIYSGWLYVDLMQGKGNFFNDEEIDSIEIDSRYCQYIGAACGLERTPKEILAMLKRSMKRANSTTN